MKKIVHPKLKNTLALIIALIIILCMCSCTNSESAIESQTLKYMKNKYDCDFSISKINYSEAEILYDEIKLTTSQFPDKIITVHREKEDDNYKFSDDFFKILKEEEYKEILDENLYIVFPNNKTFFMFENNTFDNDYGFNADLKEVMKIDKAVMESTINVFVLSSDVRRDDFQTWCDDVSLLLRDNYFYTTLYIYRINQEEFDNLNEENYLIFLEENQNNLICSKETIK